MANVRSVGVGFDSFINKNVNLKQEEDYDKRKISDKESSVLEEYFNENESSRDALYYMAYAQMKGYRIVEPSLDMDNLIIDIPASELVRAGDEFERLIIEAKNQKTKE